MNILDYIKQIICTHKYRKTGTYKDDMGIVYNNYRCSKCYKSYIDTDSN